MIHYATGTMLNEKDLPAAAANPFLLAHKILGVSLISYFYIFGAIVLLFISIFYDANANQIDIGARFGLSNAPEQLMRVLLALFSLIMVFGYMRLRKWGYWIMIAYSVLFGVMSSLLSLSNNQQPFTGNIYGH